MKLKITALVIALMMLFNIGAFASFPDVNAGSGVGNAVEQLSKLGIINGFGDGYYYPDQTLTRAQFAKIAVCMLGEEKSAAARSENVVFSDVGASHWASGYINYIAEREIINGYPDGTFGAEDTITYAQALTILIRLLGYSGEDVAYKWPEGYIKKANSLGITQGMSFGTYEYVTRGNAAYVIYNTLLAEKKEGSTLKLLSSSSVEDVVIYGDWEIDAALSNGNISTTDGTYKLADNSNIDSSVYGSIGTLYLDGEGRATAFVPEKETVRTVTVISAAKNSGSGKVEISFTEDKATRSESFGANAPLYYDGKSTTLENGISAIEAGREALLFFAQDGTFERMYLKESSLVGPVTIQGGYSHVYTAFNISNSGTLKVIRNGSNASITDISAFDVAYYMPGNNTLYAYTDKVSGTYEEAYPIKANVTSVLVGGKEYSLSTQKAIGRMNTSDSAFELGDRVTLLFGRNGEVVDVVDLASGGSLDLVVLTSSYKQISQEAQTQGESVHYVTVVLSDGSETTYETDKDYTEYIGNVMRIQYSGGIAKLSAITHSPVYGEFDSSIPALDGHWLASDCVILELVKNTSDGATVKKIDVRDIAVTNLSKNQVIHAQTSGELKDISFLYVTDVTKSDADFGVVTDMSGSTYTVLIDDKKTSVTTALKLSRGSAVEIQQTTDGQLPKSMISVATGSGVDGYSSGRIRMNGENYIVSDYVKIYGGRQASEFESMSMSELLASDDVTNVTLYSDRSLSSGGIVRVIVVKTK